MIEEEDLAEFELLMLEDDEAKDYLIETSRTDVKNIFLKLDL